MIISRIKDILQGRAPVKARRSSAWPRVRDEHLKREPRCSVCGSTKKLEVHHVRPFFLAPELELDPTNLITLCESGRFGINCHLAIGHRGSFKKANPQVHEDAAWWNRKLFGK